MVNNSLHGSITSICKNMLPFSFKKRRGLPPTERRLSEIQLKNLKWQQESFHQIIKLTGLQKEGILSDAEISDFKSHLMDALMEVNAEQEHSSILRDKLLFLQELYFAKCILEDEYHSMKSLLLHRLSVAEGETDTPNEWSIVEFKDRSQTQISKSKSRNGSSKKPPQIKGSTSVLGLVLATHRNERVDQHSNKSTNVLGSLEYDPSWEKHEKKIETKAMLMMERSEPESEQRDRSGKKQWGFSGFKKWKRKSSEDESTEPVPSEVKSDFVDGFVRVEAVDSSKQIKRKLQAELSLEKEGIENEQPPVQPKSDSASKCSAKPCSDDLDDQLEAIWANSTKWATFDDEEDENCHPNQFFYLENSSFEMEKQVQKSYDCTNPFAENYNSRNRPLVSQSISSLHTNLFWTPMSS